MTANQYSFELAEILALGPPYEQDLQLMGWIDTKIRNLGVVYQLFGVEGSYHSDFEDVLLRVQAHLISRLTQHHGYTRFQYSIIQRPEIPLEMRAIAILAKTLYQEYYKFKRESSPAFSRFREQLRYSVRQHGQILGLVLTVRIRSAPECIVRLTYHKRKNARLPSRENLEPLIQGSLLRARGRKKVESLSQMISSIESTPDLQPQLPINVLASLMADLAVTINSQDLLESSPGNTSDHAHYFDSIDAAKIETETWLEQRYFEKIHASSSEQVQLRAILNEYAARYAADPKQRTPSKDLVLQFVPGIDSKSYEESLLRSRIHYICTRFRRKIRDFQ